MSINTVGSVGLYGYGVVGKGVVANLRAMGVSPVSVYVRDWAAYPALVDATDTNSTLSTTSALTRVTDPLEIANTRDIVFEAMCGAEGLPWEVAKIVLAGGRTLITSNKMMVAGHTDEITSLLAQHPNSRIYVEGCVCGGVPLIKTVHQFYTRPGVGIRSVRGIFNGSTNYLLCAAQKAFEARPESRQLPSNSITYGACRCSNCHEAARRPCLKTQLDRSSMSPSEQSLLGPIVQMMKEMGYLESDPSLDLDGTDAKCKMNILSWLIFGRAPDVWTLCTGVCDLTLADFTYMQQRGYKALRLIGTLRMKASRNPETGTPPTQPSSTESLVHPSDYTVEAILCVALVPDNSIFALTTDAYNAVELDSEATGTTTISGLGAGQKPTANAMVSDYLYHLDSNRLPAAVGSQRQTPSQQPAASFVPSHQEKRRFVVRRNLTDQAAPVGVVIDSYCYVESDEPSLECPTMMLL